MNKHNNEYFLVTYNQKESFDRIYQTVPSYRRFDYLKDAREESKNTPYWVVKAHFSSDSGDLEHHKIINY